MGTNRPGWQVVNELNYLPSGRVDIITTTGEIITCDRLTIWRVT